MSSIVVVVCTRGSTVNLYIFMTCTNSDPRSLIPDPTKKGTQVVPDAFCKTERLRSNYFTSVILLVRRTPLSVFSSYR